MRKNRSPPPVYQLAAHLLLHKIHNLATLGFPVPDTDHQKHVSSFGKTLVVARLYIAMWMQCCAVSRCEQEAPEVKPVRGRRRGHNKMKQQCHAASKAW